MYKEITYITVFEMFLYSSRSYSITLRMITILQAPHLHTPLFQFRRAQEFFYCSSLFSRVSLVKRSNAFHIHQSNMGFCNASSPQISVNGDGEDGSISPSSLKVLRRLTELGIDPSICMFGEENRLLCPKCNGGESEEQSLSLFIANDGSYAMWTCHRGKCGWKGCTKAHADMIKLIPKPSFKEFTPESLNLEPLCDQLIEYFAARMITRKTLERNSVMQRRSGDEVAIAFTYTRNGMITGCKYRGADKKFWQEKDTEKIFYGLDDIDGASEIIIVEGEIDKLSMEEAGFTNCVSVPDGAPAKVSNKDLPSEEQDVKYKFLWNCKDYLSKASRIILATDGDAPGEALAEELARRIGKERCWRVKWPKKHNDDLKDANEVLLYLGHGVLKEVVEKAELYPIRGLFNFEDFFSQIDTYYYHNFGVESCISTGWKAVDEFYTVVPGELTVVSGVPNSGKSEWIDALLCNINKSSDWRFALCSMENKVEEHARKLLEKHLKKPFFVAKYAQNLQRMSVEELEEGKKWLNETFFLIRCDDDCLPNIDWVLHLAKAAVLRKGIRGLVIDPYNELDHQRYQYQTETEYVSKMLTRIKRFAQLHSCHVWFVAHPRQLHNWDGGPPSLYDISGSAHFMNKCDNGVVIHRQPGTIDEAMVYIRKVRNKVAGRVGEATLSYNRSTGEYTDIHTT